MKKSTAGRTIYYYGRTFLTLGLLAPLVPLYVIILAVILVIYVIVVWLLFRRTHPCSG